MWKKRQLRLRLEGAFRETTTPKKIGNLYSEGDRGRCGRHSISVYADRQRRHEREHRNHFGGRAKGRRQDLEFPERPLTFF